MLTCQLNVKLFWISNVALFVWVLFPHYYWLWWCWLYWVFHFWYLSCLQISWMGRLNPCSMVPFQTVTISDLIEQTLFGYYRLCNYLLIYTFLHSSSSNEVELVELIHAEFGRARIIWILEKQETEKICYYMLTILERK